MYFIRVCLQAKRVHFKSFSAQVCSIWQKCVCVCIFFRRQIKLQVYLHWLYKYPSPRTIIKIVLSTFDTATKFQWFNGNEHEYVHESSIHSVDASILFISFSTNMEILFKSIRRIYSRKLVDCCRWATPPVIESNRGGARCLCKLFDVLTNSGLCVSGQTTKSMPAIGICFVWKIRHEQSKYAWPVMMIAIAVRLVRQTNIWHM